MINPDALLKENEIRKSRLFPDYDPVIGTGSLIERKPFQLSENDVIYLPVYMFEDEAIQAIINDFGNLEGAFELAESRGEGQELVNEFKALRCKYDFEFWAFSCVKIKPKKKVGKHSLVPFTLRPAQRKLLFILERERLAGKPIRIILLKARQWGGSTLIQIYMTWLQLFHYTEWNSAIVADVEDQARNVRSMLNRVITNHPAEIGKFTVSNFEGSAKIKQINERNSIIQLGSMQKPDSLRSFDFSMIHLTEIGLWKKTEGKSPDDVIQSLRGALSDEAGSLEALESTAKGVGNYFHNEWMKAEQGLSASIPVFVSWFEIELYMQPFNDEVEKRHFASTLSNYEVDVLWQAGATLEGIKWYRWKSSTMSDHWRMMSEFPTTPEEAFQSTGRRAFQPKYINNVRAMCVEPKYIGDLFADAQSGKEALNNIEFDETNNGRLKVWKLPTDMPDKYRNKTILHRFALFADIGGRSEEADKSDITVIDRLPLVEGGMPEVVANWNGNIDQDLFAWIAVQLAKFYDNGLLAVEVNSLDKEGNEGEHYLTVLDEIAPYYHNLFTRTTPDQIKQGIPNKYGFHTNRSTKPMLIDHLNKLLRESGYVERDSECVKEMDTYEIKPDGSYGAVEGCKDDRVMTRAGALWLALSYMPPVIVKERTVPKLIRTSTAMM